MALISAIENSPELSETTRGDLRLARQDLELEARLIDDLLCLSQVARGELEVRPVNSDLHEILQQAIQVSSEVLRTRRVQLDLPFSGNSAICECRSHPAAAGILEHYS